MLVSFGTSAQPSMCWRVRTKTLRLGSGSPNAPRYICVMSLIPICGEQAEADAVPPLLPAGAARSACKDNDVLGDQASEFQFQPQPPANVAVAQRLDRVRAKGVPSGRGAGLHPPRVCRAHVLLAAICCKIKQTGWKHDNLTNRPLHGIRGRLSIVRL